MPDRPDAAHHLGPPRPARRACWFARGLPLVLAPALFAVALGCREHTGPGTGFEPESAGGVAAASGLVFRRVTVGGAHTCALTATDLAYCWGANDAGQLGIASTTRKTSPVPVVGGRAFSQLSAGWGHTCGVTVEGRLFCWGLNHLGQLGDGTHTDRHRPIRIARGLRFLQVSAGNLHTCAVTVAHIAYCWGHSQAGTLGNGVREGSSLPVRVVRDLAFRGVTAGNQFTCGVTTENIAYCWGLNLWGQLGAGTDAGPELCFTGDGDNACSLRPIRVRRGLVFRQVDAGDSHACGVTVDAIAYCWGASFAGQLGRGVSTGEEHRPVRVVGGLVFRSVGVGEFHTCGVTTDGAAWCWGENFSGQLGTGSDSGPETCPELDVSCSSRPVRVVGGLVFGQVAAGGSHSCGVTGAGRVHCWGSNREGQLGDGTTRSRPRPRPVAAGG